MEYFFKSFFGKFLRFLLFIPLAFLVSILTEILAKWSTFFDPAGFTTSGMIFNAIIIGGTPSFTFVYSGCIIAPNFKKTISILLSFIIVLSNGLALFKNTTGLYLTGGILEVLLSWENILLLIASISGAIFASTVIIKSENDL